MTDGPSGLLVVGATQLPEQQNAPTNEPQPTPIGGADSEMRDSHVPSTLTVTALPLPTITLAEWLELLQKETANFAGQRFAALKRQNPKRTGSGFCVYPFSSTRTL